MGRPKRLVVMSEKPSAEVKAVRRPKVSKGKKSLSSLPTELQLGIVHDLPRTSLLTICQLNKHWRSVGTDEFLRRMLPVPPHEGVIKSGEKQDLRLTICHYIDTNNADALRYLLNFRLKHPYLRPLTASLLLADPASLRARVTKDEEERFCMDCDWYLSSNAVNAAFKYNDMSCMQLLIDHGLADYSDLLNEAVKDDYGDNWYDEWLARPITGADSRGGHNSVLNWLLAFPPRHVVQAMLLMWGRLFLHTRLQPLCDWRSSTPDRFGDNMLIVTAGHAHPASLQAINELRMMVEILTDDVSGRVIPEARQPLSHALRIARGMASMWPGTSPLIAEYLQSVCTWEDHHSRRNGSNTNYPPPPPAPPLILPPEEPNLHRLIDLKTKDEMLEPENWRKLKQVPRDQPLLWLVSTEFLTDDEAARRMRCFKRSLRELYRDPDATYSLLHAAGAFRRWRCVKVVLGALRGRWPDLGCFGNPQMVLCRAILDAVHGEPGCADGHIIRKLLRTGARNIKGLKSFVFNEDMGNEGPFRGGWFGWQPFRLAFFEWQQDREQRETPACKEMRDAVLNCMSISGQRKAHYFLVGEPSKALYRRRSKAMGRQAGEW